MSETPGEYTATSLDDIVAQRVAERAASFQLIHYFVIADGKTLFEGDNEGKALRYFLDNRYAAGVKDISLHMKRRKLPPGGWPDIVWD
jgi:hypothetical protein